MMNKEFILIVVFTIIVILFGIWKAHGIQDTTEDTTIISNANQQNINYAPKVKESIVDNPPKYLSEPIYPKKKYSKSTKSKVKFFPLVERRVVSIEAPTGDINKPENILLQKNERLT